MNDMAPVIASRSDQINADDLLAGPRTIRITAVDIKPGTEQPVAISIEDDSKVWRPCKSMSRCLVAVWGPDANKYIGHSLTLYCDPKVLWGGLPVGGIRISHMSHIDKEVTLVLTATRATRKPFTVRPLAHTTAAIDTGKLSGRDIPPLDAPPSAKRPTVATWLDALQRDLDTAETADAVIEIGDRPEVERALESLRNGALDRLNKMLRAALERTKPPAAADDTFPGDLPSRHATR